MYKRNHQEIGMKTFTVFNIVLSDSDIDNVNSLGWDGAIKNDEKIRAYLDSGLGFSKYDPEYFQYYTKVGTVEANDLEDAFFRSNYGDANAIDNFSGMMRSLSVGDIVEVDGEYHMVDTFGFQKLEEFYT